MVCLGNMCMATLRKGDNDDDDGDGDGDDDDDDDDDGGGGDDDDDDNNSVQFSGYLLRCRLNSTRAHYKDSTETQLQHKTGHTHKKRH